MPVLSPRVRHPQSENIPPGQMEPEHPSPSTSRHTPIFSPVQLNKDGGSSLDLGNDDAAELKARRRSRVLEIQRQRLASSPVSENDRSKSTPLSTLSNAQVAEHYKNCIKLSAENKINAKNAFGLHLIDYMSDLIKKKELNNFQVASSTLDASAKIYAGRVDAIHSDMYKVLGGLGQQKKVETEEGEGEVGVEGSEKGSPGQEDKKRKKRKHPKKIKANVKTITMESYNREFEIDPLFKKTSASFDEGGTKGLLLNNLSCEDNRSQLVLDSQQVILGQLAAPLPGKRNVTKCTIEGFEDVFSKVMTSEICPPFNDFTFTNWSAEDEGIFKSLLDTSKSKKSHNEHAFDSEAEIEPIPGTTDMETADYDPGGSGGGDYGGGDSDNDSTTSERVQNVHNNLDKDAQLVNTVMESIKRGNIGELMHVLASENNDYSHFNTSVLNTWAGPSLWTMKGGALIKSKLAPASQAELTEKSKRKRKAPFRIDLESSPDLTALLNESRAATTVKEARLNEYSKVNTTLPIDLRVKADEIFKRDLKEGLLLQQQVSCQDVEDGVGDYDYDNTNDANNFCTALNNDDDDDNDAGLPETQDSVANEFQMTHDFDMTNNRTVFGQESGALNATTAGGPMNLIDQPRRVQRIEIDYARTAKKIDVKKLKSSMWQLLTGAEKKEEKNPPAPGEQPASTNLMEGQLRFSDLVKKLPDSVSPSMARNLSPSICFVCLLHLVNEKKLSIDGSDDMSDFTISQG